MTQQDIEAKIGKEQQRVFEIGTFISAGVEAKLLTEAEGRYLWLHVERGYLMVNPTWAKKLAKVDEGLSQRLAETEADDE